MKPRLEMIEETDGKGNIMYADMGGVEYYKDDHPQLMNYVDDYYKTMDDEYYDDYWFAEYMEK